ncbi:hypothetical protein WSS_A42725, partial [Rhodococcus opacus M213]
VAPHVAQIMEGGRDLGVVGAVFALLNGECPLQWFLGVGRIPELEPRDAQSGEEGRDLAVVGAKRNTVQLVS